MKKLSLLLLSMCLGLFASAQFAVTNYSTQDLKVSVQYGTNGSCETNSSAIQLIKAGAQSIFNVPYGMKVVRVGVGNGISSGGENNPCILQCAISPNTSTFIFNWSTCPTSGVEIFSTRK